MKKVLVLARNINQSSLLPDKAIEILANKRIFRVDKDVLPDNTIVSTGTEATMLYGILVTSQNEALRVISSLRDIAESHVMVTA